MYYLVIVVNSDVTVNLHQQNCILWFNGLKISFNLLKKYFWKVWENFFRLKSQKLKKKQTLEITTLLLTNAAVVLVLFVILKIGYF